MPTSGSSELSARARSLEDQIQDDLASYRIQLRIVSWAITIVVCLAALFGLAIMISLVWTGEKVIVNADMGPFDVILKKTVTQGESLFKMAVAGIATVTVRQLLVPIKKQLYSDVKEKTQELTRLQRQNVPRKAAKSSAQ